ncbi:9460_t:CDS:2, partial [Paraglomus occultum]
MVTHTYYWTNSSVGCLEKTVKEAYHILCNKCASANGVCAKCQGAVDIKSGESDQDSRNLEKILPLLSERKRRTYLRKLEKGEEIDITA